GLVLLSLAAAQARKPRRETAEEEVQRLASEAVDAYQAGQYDNAVALLTRAHAIRPLARLLYNLAQAYEKLNDVTNACAPRTRYVDAPDAEARLKAKAQREVDGCEAARQAMAMAA